MNFFRRLINVIFQELFCKSPMPDKLYCQIQYRLKTGKKLNLSNPVLFNEKLQWLKLYNRLPELTKMVDKYEVRQYIIDTIGEEYLFPLLGVWNTFDEIPFDTLPDKFVLKCTHDSGSFVICKDKKSLDIAKVRKHFKKRLSRNYGKLKKEWAYENVKPRIIGQKFMSDAAGSDLIDYKIFCFNGEPKIIMVDYDSHTTHKRNFYSPQWEYQPVSIVYPSLPEISIPKPEKLELMLALARKLSAGKVHMRVDFYEIEGKVYFGEMTFYNDAGYGKFEPPEWNKIFGDWLELPKNNHKRRSCNLKGSA